jgi:hypothetical protein
VPTDLSKKKYIIIGRGGMPTGNSVLQVDCTYNSNFLQGVAVVVDGVTKITGANGVVTFADISKGETTIVATKDGFVTDTSTENIQDTFVEKAIELQPVTVLFNIKDVDGNPIENVSVTFGTTSKNTDENGQAEFVQVLDGTYNYSIISSLYDDVAGTLEIARNSQTKTFELTSRVIEAYAAEAVIAEATIKLNAGVGDSNYDYNAYAADTETTNDLTIDATAVTSAEIGEVAQVLPTEDTTANITVNANQDEAEIEFNNGDKIDQVNINIIAKDLYLAFTKGSGPTGTSKIYFKNNTLPFIPNDNKTFENTEFVYYTRRTDGSMMEHTATTSSVTSGGANTYNGTTLWIDSPSSYFINGIWTRNNSEDLEIDNGDATITTSSYLTDVNPIIPRTDNFIFSCAKLNPEQWDTKLIIGGQVKQFIDNQEFYVKSNQLIEIYATKHNSTNMKDTYNKYFYISNDKHYKKVNFIINVNVSDATIKFTINGVEFEYTGSTANIDCYEGETINWELSKPGFITQTGSYTVPSYPTIKTYDAGTKTLVAE